MPFRGLFKPVLIDHMTRQFRRIEYKDAVYNICGTRPDNVLKHIKQARHIIESHIRNYPEFLTSFTPLPAPQTADRLIERMYKAARLCGTGPMAGVAGAFAEYIGRSVTPESGEVIIENGGDIYCSIRSPLTIGVFAGTSPLSGKLGIRVTPDGTPLGICSSSSTMGHSRSFGNCHLATVFSPDTITADCAATACCNMVKTAKDIKPALEFLSSIAEINGGMIIKDGHMGIIGQTPQIIRITDEAFSLKITKHSSHSDSYHDNR